MTRLESGMTQTADQTSEKGVVLCMNRNLKDMIPIILIVGKYSAIVRPARFFMVSQVKGIQTFPPRSRTDTV